MIEQASIAATCRDMKWDSNDVFYAVTAVESEKWVIQDCEQGVRTQAGSLCRP
jgi:hypothetical protein